MRALNIRSEGQAAEVSEIAVPDVTDGHVLIRVKAAGLNGIDVHIAGGMLAEMMPHEYPVVIGRDVAGVVEAVGAGVEDVKPGDQVLGNVPFLPPIQHGTLAEYALVAATAVAPKPVGLDFVSAAAIPLAGAAAVAVVDTVDPQPGQTVLVDGASGGVGSFVVQLLKARGATVIATATADDADRLLGLGADEVVDFTAGTVADQVLATHPDGVDALVELAAMSPDAAPLSAVRPGGKVGATTQAGNADALAAAGLTGATIMAGPVREVVHPLAEKVAAGELVVDVEQVLSLDEALAGLATIGSGKARGKIVVKLPD